MSKKAAALPSGPVQGWTSEPCGLGFWGLGFRIWGLGFRVWDLGFGV